MRNVQFWAATMGGILAFALLISFVVVPVWSECLSKNSWLFCAAVLGGK